MPPHCHTVTICSLRCNFALALLLQLLLAVAPQLQSSTNLYRSDLVASIKPVHCVPFRKSENSFCDDVSCVYPKSVGDCSGNGQCLAPSGLCLCNAGYEGDDCGVKSSPCVSGVVTSLTRPRGYFTDGSPPPPRSGANNSKSGYRTDLNCTWAINPSISSGEFAFPIAIVVEYMDVELNYDWLYIFSGPVINQSRALIDTGSGNNQTVKTGSLTGTMQRPDGTYCRFSNDVYDDCAIKGAMDSQAGPVTVQFQTDGSNYNATTRNNQDFFGFRAYYFVGSDPTNLKAMNELIGHKSALFAGRTSTTVSQRIYDTQTQVAGEEHELLFTCPVRSYTILTCSKEPPCVPACDARVLTCCQGFCVPIDEYGDPFPTLQEIIMVRPELLYRLNPAVNPYWTNSSNRSVERFPGTYTEELFFNTTFAAAHLGVIMSSELKFVRKTTLLDPNQRVNVTSIMGEMTDAEIANYVAVMDSIGATNITVRRCKFTVRSIRAGVMTAAMRFEYKANRKWPYDPTVPAMREATWMLQPLKVQPNRCVATGSSLTSVAAGSFSTFTVFARDQFSNPRILGGELANALLISKDYTTDAPLQLSADVVNNGNGTYFVEFLLTKTGNYFLAINVIPSGEVAPKQVNDILASSFNVLGSPLSVFVMSGPINIDAIAILGNMQSGVAGYFLMHVVRIYDVFGNLASPDVASKLSVTVLHSANNIAYSASRTQSRFAAADIFALEGPGDFMLSWMPVMTGWHVMSILLNRSNINIHINNSPFNLSVLPAPIDGSSSESYGIMFDNSVLTVSDNIPGFIVLRDAFGNVRREPDIIYSSRFQVSFEGIELSDCPYIQNTTLLEILKGCPTIFNGNMSLSKRCVSSNYLAANSKQSIIDAFTLRGSVDHTPDRHDKLLAWLQNTVKDNTCNQIARIAIDTASVLPSQMPPGRWSSVPPRHTIATLVNTNRRVVTTAEQTLDGQRVFSLLAVCTAAGLYKVSVSVSNQLLYGLPHLLLVQSGAPETSTAKVFGSLLNRDYFDRPMHSGYVAAADPYTVQVMLRDRFGNFVWTGKPDISVSLGDLTGYRCFLASKCFPAVRSPSLAVSMQYLDKSIIDSNDGTYIATVKMPIPGQFDVNVFLNIGPAKTTIGLSPYVVNVVSGVYSLSNTFVEGQGVMSCGAGVICSFSVVNRDRFKNLIVLPDAKPMLTHSCIDLMCHIQSDSLDAYIELYKVDEISPVLLMLSSANLKVNSEAGKALLSYAIQQAGQYSWKILIAGQPAPGSPFRFDIFGGITSPLTTVVDGYGLICAHPGFPSTFVIRTRDSFSNYKTAGGDIVEVRVQGALLAVSNVFDTGRGRYVASYTIERFGRSLDYSGQYKISVAVNGFSIPGSPFSSPACVGFEYHPRIFAHEGLHLVGTATYENAQGRTAENAQTPAGGVVRLVHGASTTNSPHNQAGAMWFAELMPVGEGFVIEFEFQLSDALLHCRVTSPTQNCLPHGGDGFAFVIQAGNRSALGGYAEDLGYGGIMNSLAVEFDTWYNYNLNDYFEHHIAIQTGGLKANNPTHNSIYKIAYSVDGPVFTDGLPHSCRIRYDPIIQSSHLQDAALNAGSAAWAMLNNGSGALQIFIDDFHRPLLVAPVKLDSIISLENNTFAYVGITSSTGASHQSVDIGSFRYKDVCPHDCNNVGTCHRGVCTCEGAFSGASCEHFGRVKTSQSPNTPVITGGGAAALQSSTAPS